MTIAAKREKLHDYINAANDKKIEAIFSIVEVQIGENYDHWEDEDFVAEIKSRIYLYENGIDKGLSWEEVKTKARNQLKAKHSREEKIALMKQASSDPLFLADLKEINDDFDIADHEK